MGKILAELGAQVINADAIAHALTAPGTPLLKKIVDHFGLRYLNPDGSLNRQRLAELVFSNEPARQELNRLTHPAILEAIKEKIRAVRQQPGVLVIEAPLLIETGLTRWVDEVWVVTAPLEIKLARLQARGLAPDTARRVLQAQLPEAEKIKHAHRIIDNSGSLTALREQVIKIWTELQSE